MFFHIYIFEWEMAKCGILSRVGYIYREEQKRNKITTWPSKIAQKTMEQKEKKQVDSGRLPPPQIPPFCLNVPNHTTLRFEN
jgi:hypothetical protein